LTANTDLHKALTQLLAAIAAGGSASGAASITDCLARLDQLRQGLGDEAPAMLRHYLEKRSYEKAMAFLEGRDPEGETGR